MAHFGQKSMDDFVAATRLGHSFESKIGFWSITFAVVIGFFI